MFKRLTSILTAVFMLSAYTPLFAKAASADSILLSESFNSCVTNANDSQKISATGVDARVVERADSDKAVYAKAWSDKAKMTADIKGASQLIIFESDIKIDGEKTNGNLFSLTCGDKNLTVLKLDKSVLKLSDGKEVSTLQYGKWYKIGVRLNLTAGLADVFINGKAYVRNWYLPSAGYVAPTKVVWDIISPDNGYSVLMLDNVRIYNGVDFLPDSAFPTDPYNTESDAFEETTKLPEYDKVLGVYDYESSGASGIVEKNSKISWVDFGDGNKGMKFTTTASEREDPFFDVTFPELATEGRYVIEAKIRPHEIIGSNSIEVFDAKDGARSGQWRLGAVFRSDGGIYMRSDGTSVGRWSKGEWTTLALCYNVSGGSVDVWLATGNEELKPVLKGYSTSDVLMPTQFRISAQIYAGSKLEFDVDDIKCYLGTEPRDLTGSDNTGADDGVRKSVMENEERTKPLIGDASIFMINNDTLYSNGERKSYADSSAKPYVSSDGVFMIPAVLLKEVTGCDVMWNSGTGEIKLNGKWILTIGSDKAVSSEKTVALGKAVEVINGEAYLPLRSVCENILSKSIYWDDRGFVILSDSKFRYTDSAKFDEVYEPIDTIYRYMQYERPTGAEVTETIKKLHPNNGHPRLMFTDEAGERMKALIASSKTAKTTYEKLARETEIQLANGASHYFKSDIPDSQKQSQASVVSTAMERFSAMYQITKDTKYLDFIVDTADILCGYDTLGQWTSLLATGMWCYDMGLAYDITYNYLNQNEAGRQKLAYWRTRIRDLVYPTLISTYESGVGYRWYNIVDNFGQVIGGGHTILLLSIADETDYADETAYLIENVLKSVEYSASLFGPDGAWYEGLSYWDFSMLYYTAFCQSLKNSCGTMYGFEAIPGLSDAGYAMLYGITPNGMFNFHDTDDSLENDMSPYFFATEYNNPDMGKAWSKMYHQCFESRPTVWNVRELLWYDASYDDYTGLDIPLDRYFRTAEYGTMRNSWDTKNPTFVGIHGGFTKLAHDMLDVGEFIFEDNGIRWAKDLGNDDYGLKGYWADEGYNIYRKRTEGENCLVINPRAEYYGQELSKGAKLLFFESKPKAAMAAYDLSDVYSSDAKKVTRGYYFGDDRHSLTVRDEIELIKENSTVYWFMHTPASIEINGNKAILSYSGKKLEAEVLCDADSFELLDMDPKPFDHVPVVEGQAVNSGRKLAVKATDSGNFSITVKLSPVRDDYEITPASNAYISDWTLPDGAIEASLKLSSVSVDGNPIEGFNPLENTISISVPVSQTEFPQISAQAPVGTVNVEYGEDLYEGAKITVDNPGSKSGIYYVDFEFDTDREIKVTDDIKEITPSIGNSGISIVKQKSWFSNSVPQPVNNPDNLSDVNMETRWASDLDGGWVEYDFGKPIDIDGIVYAIYDGTNRANKFEILYSEDGINYKRVYNGKSLGTNSGYEKLAIPGKVRFVRYVGHGSTVGNWTSVLEFGAYTKN